MNRMLMQAAIAAVPILLALGSPSHAQYTGQIPELNRSSVSQTVQLKSQVASAKKFVEATADKKTLDAMSESSTVRTVCGVGIASPVVTMTAIDQTLDQKVYVAGLSAAIMGGFILALASFFTLRWKTFGWRASRAAALWGLSAFTTNLPFADFVSPALIPALNYAFPLVVAAIMWPKPLWNFARKVASTLQPVMPHAAPFAAVAAMCCAIFAWGAGHDRLDPVRKTHAAKVVSPSVSPVVAPTAAPVVGIPMI